MTTFLTAGNPLIEAGIAAWIGHLHTADPATLDHMAADAEYLPTSPVACALRDAVEDERARRVVTAGIEASRG